MRSLFLSEAFVEADEAVRADKRFTPLMGYFIGPLERRVQETSILITMGSLGLN